MTWLIVGLIVFLGVHSVRAVAPAWRDAMTTLIRDADTRKAMGLAARRRVEERFSNKQHVKRLIEIYSASA